MLLRREKGMQLTLALTGLLIVLVPLLAHCQDSDDTTSASKVSNDKFYMFMRPRLGHFHKFPKTSAYSEIYEEYFENVIKKNDDALKNIPQDDWRHVRPNSELCIDFLIGLQVREYVLSKPFDLIPLDACLDWLYDQSSEKNLDLERMSSDQQREMHLLGNDMELKRIFRDTEFKDGEAKIPEKIQKLVHEYMQQLLKVYSDNPRNGCHSLWLEAYNDFVEKVLLIDCQEDDESKCVHYGYANGSRDSYLKMITESTVAAGQSCYHVMQKQMKGLLEAEYEASTSGLPNTFAKRFKSHRNRVAKQSEQKHWSREMIGILQLASGTDPDEPVGLDRCVIDLDRIKNGDKPTINTFTTALAQYALENVDISKSQNDPNGRGRYGRAVTKLCRPYTDPKYFLSKTGGFNTEDESEERKPFEFYNIIYSLVRITNHEPIFQITKEQFEEDILKNGWEALYLATLTCQIISVTWGEISHESNEAAFDVKLRPNAKDIIIDWPIEVLNERLPHLYHSESPKDSIVANLNQGALFGRKLKLFGRKKDKTSKDVTVAPAAAPVAVQPVAPVAPQPVYQPQPTLHPALQMASDRQQQQQQQQESETRVSKSNKFMGMLGFSKSKEQQQQQQSSLTPSMQMQQQSMQNHVQPAKPMMSLDTIEMFKKLHGHYPQLSDQYKKAYPELPADTSGTYPKELGNKPLFQDPSVVSSPNSLYNSRDWQEVPWAKKPKKAKKERKSKSKARSSRRYEEPEDDEEERVDDDDDLGF